MKTTIVPAQITTVEDKIAGNLNLTQVVLLVMTLLGATCIYVLFPTPMKFSLVKLALMIIASTGLSSLAIRLKGKVFLQWILVIATYALRPKYYIFNKQDTTNRDMVFEKVQKVSSSAKAMVKIKQPIQLPTPTSAIALESVLQNTGSIQFAFHKKGGARVIFSEN